ncbi:MAG: hypothetical protein NXI32_30595, partial [bacterium]|nr:hypothetical protein [bacterium]
MPGSGRFPCLIKLSLWLCLASLCLSTTSVQADESEAEVAIRTLTSYCYDCHVGDGSEGGIQVDFFESKEGLENHIETVEKIILVLKEQQMPPAEVDQPSVEERVTTLQWIEQQ